EKTVQSRTFAVPHTIYYLQLHRAQARSHIEANGGVEILEQSHTRIKPDRVGTVRHHPRIITDYFARWPGTVRPRMSQSSLNVNKLAAPALS
ncbi:hypothetical protein EDD22DRAFT_919527, partial [Suillus occidentalis]